MPHILCCVIVGKYKTTQIFISNVLIVHSGIEIEICLHAWLTPYKVKVGVLRPVQQPGSYWDSSTAFVTCESQTHTEVTACD